MSDREQRVTPLELFFDLVFVYAVTQVTQLMSHDPTWRGIGRDMLALAALWWSWTGYAWLTNTLEPEEGVVRAGMFAAMAAMFAAAMAVPGAFGSDAVTFGVAYLIVRVLHLGLYAVAGKGDPGLLGAIVRLTPSAVVAPAIILAAGFTDGRVQTVAWIAALLVDYAGALVGRGEGWRVSPAHFAERHGLVVIVALGESVVALGLSATDVGLSLGIITAGVLGVATIAALWWAYFDVYAVLAQHRLSGMTGAPRARFARDYYSYLHLPMVAGIVLFALGLKRTIEEYGEVLDAIATIALCGGLAMYFLTHVIMRVRVTYLIRRSTSERPGWIGPGRLAAAVAMLAAIPVVRELPALGSLSLVAAVCWALIAWDVIHYREHRVEIRQARP